MCGRTGGAGVCNSTRQRRSPQSCCNFCAVSHGALLMEAWRPVRRCAAPGRHLGRTGAGEVLRSKLHNCQSAELNGHCECSESAATCASSRNHAQARNERCSVLAARLSTLPPEDIPATSHASGLYMTCSCWTRAASGARMCSSHPSGWMLVCIWHASAAAHPQHRTSYSPVQVALLSRQTPTGS